MSELEKTQNIQKTEEDNLTLIEKLKLKRSGAVLLLDISGSMSSDIEPGKSKIAALREVVAGTTASKMYWFGTQYGECTKNTIPDPSGSTYLAALLNFIKSEGHRSVIILTDGDITDKPATVLAKEGLNIKVMYIGAGPRPVFLDELASSGFATTEDLRQTKSLSGKLQLLISSGEERKKAIEL